MRMIIVVMGVAGSGKTVVGRRLAENLQWPFLDADDFHPPENLAKMAAGVPLDDDDRIPWLDAMHAALTHVDRAILACSALKERYRARLRAGLDVRFVFLRAERELIAERVRHREHFFPPELVDSQFADLEPPRDAIEIDAARPADEIVNEIYRAVVSPGS